jgi:hypothetical protein
MKPGLDKILSGAADAINTELAPHFRGVPAALGHASMIRLLMLAAAESADREPDILMSEIAAMRVLFEEASVTLLPGDLCEKLHAAAEDSAPQSFTVSALTDLCNRMKTVLIELQVELEDIPAPWARKLEAEVWTVLRLGVERRQLNLRGL